MMFGWGKVATFVGGALFGSAGIKLLTSKDAKKVYAHTTAAALRVADCAMTAATSVRENVDDILAEAKQINEDRVAAEAEIVVESVESEE